MTAFSERFFRACFVLAFLTFCLTPVHGISRYIETNGSTTSDCTEADPCNFARLIAFIDAGGLTANTERWRFGSGTHNGDGTFTVPSSAGIVIIQGEGIDDTRIQATRFRANSAQTLEIRDLTLRNHQFTNDNAGGCLYVNAVTESVTMSRVRVHGCETTTANAGGIRLAPTGPVVIEDCEFYDNVAAGGGGGAVYVLDQVTTLTISDTSFRDNSATSGSGGALRSKAQSTVLNRVTFENNVATNSGGSVVLDTTAFTLNDVTVTGGSTSGGEGGGIAVISGAGGSMTDVLVTGSSADAGNGGGISLDSDVACSLTNLHIESCSASGSGGGLRVIGSAAMTLTNATFLSNTAGGNGGGIHLNSADLAVTDSFSDVFISLNEATRGGGLSMQGQRSVGMTGVVHITDNTGTIAPGGVYLWDVIGPTGFLVDEDVEGAAMWVYENKGLAGEANVICQGNVDTYGCNICGTCTSGICLMPGIEESELSTVSNCQCFEGAVSTAFDCVCDGDVTHVDDDGDFEGTCAAGFRVLGFTPVVAFIGGSVLLAILVGLIYIVRADPDKRRSIFYRFSKTRTLKTDDTMYGVESIATDSTFAGGFMSADPISKSSSRQKSNSKHRKRSKSGDSGGGRRSGGSKGGRRTSNSKRNRAGSHSKRASMGSSGLGGGVGGKRSSLVSGVTLDSGAMSVNTRVFDPEIDAVHVGAHKPSQY